MGKRKKLSEFVYTIYDSEADLSIDDRQLKREATEALELAHAPYSEFKVGAALQFNDGSIIKGANQENVSYPVCLCAEGVVLAQASVMLPKKKIKSIAITTKHKYKPSDSPIAPCGLCRQSILEYENRQNEPIRLLLISELGEIYEINSVKDILPLQFDTTDLL